MLTQAEGEIEILPHRPLGRIFQEYGTMLTQAEGEIEILDPHVEAKLQLHRLAPRPTDLNRKVIGVLENTKANAAQFLDELQERLSARFRFAEVVKRSHHPGRHEGDMTPILYELAERCDVVITGVGI